VFVIKELFPKEKDTVLPYRPTSVVINVAALMMLTSKMVIIVNVEAANSNLIAMLYSTLVTLSVGSTESHLVVT